MAAWLSSCGGGKAAMEPAPACWIPVFEVPGRAGIAGVTGRRILRAIAGGERDPRRLAALRDGRIRAAGERIARSR